MSTVMVALILVTFDLATFVNISNISAVSEPIKPNFKGRFLEPSLTDAIRVTFVQATFALMTFVHGSNI